MIRQEVRHQSLEVVVGTAPGWENRWARVQRAHVVPEPDGYRRERRRGQDHRRPYQRRYRRLNRHHAAETQASRFDDGHYRYCEDDCQPRDGHR